MKTKPILAIIAALMVALATPTGTPETAQAQTGPIKLNHSLAGFDTVEDYTLSPDSRLVAYCARVSGVLSLWITPIDGSTAAGQVPGISTCASSWTWIGADGGALMLGNANPYPSSASIPTLVETTAPYASRPLFTLPAGFVSYRQIRWSQDGQWIFFSAGQTSVGQFAVFVAPASGAQPARQLTPTIAAGQGGAWDFEVTPDLSRLIVVSDELIPGTSELIGRTLPSDLLTGALDAPQRLSGPMATGGDVGFYGGGGTGTLLTFEVTPDLSRVVYFADQEADNDRALYNVPLSGSATPVRLSPPLGAGTDFSWIWTPSFGYARYMVQDLTTYRTSIFRAPVAGPASATTLMVDNGSNIGFSPSGGGFRGVLSGGRYAGNVLQIILSIGPFGGQPAAYVPITAPAPSGVTYTSPDGNTLTFTSVGTDLHRIDLSAANVQAVPLTGVTGAYPILLSNYRVVYGNSTTLYSRPLYGNNTTNQPINGATAFSGSGALVRLAGNDHWVVFRTATAPSVYELFATDLGSPRVNLPIQTYLPDLRLAR
ncbi:MAG: PD40 domain-containing protein [Anaerolineales bacterium]|nr:PD40 domain-containing protein [Anaerolineales bacterium]